jgi:aldehyde dehydrogenase (NAD+)
MFLRPALKASYRTQLLINNKWVNSSDGRTFKTINPATEELIANVQWGSVQDVNTAVNAAREAFEGPWRRTSAVQRANLLYKLADLIEKNREELAQLESLDNGKPISDARAGDLQLTIQCYRYYAGYADKVFGKTIPMNGPFFAYTRFEPKGVAGQIIPWNFPLLMQAWKLAPALAAGCTSVLKPAEQTPLSSLRVGELIIEAGFPAGVVNIVPGEGDTGAALAVHPGIDKIAFTGSTEVGLEIMSKAGVNGLKRVTLELGGKSPNIIMDDADLDLAVAQSQVGVFLNQGQCCIAGSRVFVHEKIYDEFVRRTALCTAGRKLGNPLDDSTGQGPQVDENQMKRVLSYIEKGKQEGARLITGGKRFGNKGFFVEPTVFADVTDNMTIAKEEIFGPVFSILKFKDLDEVIARANNSNYGLGAGVVTKNVETALKVVNGIRSGTVYVNCYDVFSENLPFGGFKDSGIGRELGEDGIMNYLEQKSVVIKTSNDTLP